MQQRFGLVFNDQAGMARPKLLRDVLARLAENGAEVFAIAARSAVEATERVAALTAEDASAVIAAGGDGTIRAVAAGASSSGIAVGIIPLGTGNVMAREIGLPARANEIAHALLQGETVGVRGGLVNGAPFFLMAGAGFDGRIVATLDMRVKRRIGRLAYGVPIFNALTAKPKLFDIDVDGVSYGASWAVITNAQRYGGSFILTRATQLGANQLIAVIVEGNRRRHLLGASLALAAGRLGDRSTTPDYVRVLPACRVAIGRQSPVAMEVDGDEAGATPVEISAYGPHVRIIVPEAYAKALTNRHTNRLRFNV